MTERFRGGTIELDQSVIDKVTDAAVVSALDRLGLDAVSDIRLRLYRSRHTGEWYFKTKKARESGNPDHQASAPGEPPAVDTGRMANAVLHAHYGAAGHRGISVGACEAAMLNPAIGEAYTSKYHIRGGLRSDRRNRGPIDPRYPLILEIGNRRLRGPRPWLRPTFDAIRAKGAEWLAKAVAGARKRAS